MSLLTNTNIKQILSQNISEESQEKLVIFPLDEDCITPVGYDLRVGNDYIINGEEKKLSDDQELKIAPREIALIHTLEEVRMPKNKTLSGIINSKVSLSCKGLSNISTTVDADWNGRLLIAVHNHSNKNITLKFREAFCTIIFFENKSPAKEGRYSKPHGRPDILTEAFKKNTRSTPSIVVFIINCIPPLFSVASLWVAAKLFSEKPILISATVAIGVFVSNYITKFIDPAIGYFRQPK